ncbi:conserved Plasmodium protein, unknown function [Plasmodium ovale]|uniref:Uncharacterized protein n=1 Tax=Plasmodium ovale TaxID=36330 RepID=A0A1D3TM56_PLAOA|nr:conserved Plasmodium protein, unknown function [Plasmodium ovale]
MDASKNILLDLSALKNYYNKVFTKEVLQNFQKEMKVEDVIYSYNYYSNLYSEYKTDIHEVGSDYLKSDEEVEKINSNLLNRSKKVNTEDNDEEDINYFDPMISEEAFEEKIEKTFENLNNFLKSLSSESDINAENERDVINDVLQRLKVEKINEGNIHMEDEEYYQLFDAQLNKVQLCQMTVIMLAYIIRSIFYLTEGRKIIFSNENINRILLKGVYMQNVYVQIFTLKNLKKYLVEDGENYDKMHIQIIKICIFSNSLCSYNRAHEILSLLISNSKHINEIFDFYFLKKIKKTLEHSNNIQRLRLLDLIADSINMNHEKIYDMFRIDKKNDSIKLEEGSAIPQEGKFLPNGLSPFNFPNGDIFDCNTFFFESDYEKDCYTLDDISFIEPNFVKEKMNKHNLSINKLCKMVKINVYKYLYKVYIKDDLLLKVNVLEVFSKLVQNEYYSNSVMENIHFLQTILNDLKEPDEEILHMSIMNSIISYTNINTAVFNFLVNAHSNILLKKIVEFLPNSSNVNVERIIVGIKSFGYFFSIKQTSKLLMNIDSDVHMLAINNINSHAHINVLRHSINIWIKILPSESMSFQWFQNLIYRILFKKVIIILREINDPLIHTNIFQLLQIMVNFDIAHLILEEHWLVKSLQRNFETDCYELKMSRYQFFTSLYEINKSIITNNAYAHNLIRNFVENVPKRY